MSLPFSLPRLFLLLMALCVAAAAQEPTPAPESPGELRVTVEQAAGVAREIDARYVVTYRPLLPVADAPPGQYRKLDVLPRRLGLTVRARPGYFIKK